MKAMITSSIRTTILFLLCVLTLTLKVDNAVAQADTVKQEAETAFIEQGDISDELGKILPELKRVKEIGNSKEEFFELDSLTNDGIIYLDSTSAKLREKIDGFSLNSLENKRTEWISYDQLVVSYEKQLKTRMDLLNTEVTLLNTNLRLWQNTVANIEETQSGTELLDNLVAVIDTIQAIKSLLGEEINDLFSVQKKLSELRQQIEEDRNLIESAISETRLSIFQRNDPAIWNSIDSASAWGHFRNNFKESIKENTNVLRIYFEANFSRAIGLLIIFSILLIAFIFIKRFRQRYYKPSAILHRQAEIILSYPFISSFALSILAIIFIFPDRPQILTLLVLLVMSVPLYLVLPRIFLNQRLNSVLYVLISLYFLICMRFLIPSTSIYYRFILLIENIALIWCFYHLYRLRYELVKKAKFWGNMVIKTALPVIIILGIVFIANIVGFVRLSDYIISALIHIIYAGLLITLITLIISIVTVFLVEYRVDHGMDKEIGLALIRRVFGLVKLGAILLYIRVILVNLGLFVLLMRGYRTLMDISWTIGPAEDPTVIISLGGIITALIVILLTFFLSKWIKQFFVQDLAILKRMPKGVPAAISMISRYIIVTFGIYIALSFAGVDLGKFGLLAGALGVGIGFGLQNVVYNFVSGLILSIERPIHIGDTVEVGNLMGNVTEIGVRASKVKTFDGSEVIVPNGNLISKEVINWTLSDKKRRLMILVKTEMGVDPRKVLKIMDEEARKHPNTLKYPKPMALFDGYGSSSLDFTLYFWVYFDVSFTTKSDVALAIYSALENEGIGMPVPMQKYFPGDARHPLESRDDS